MTLGNLGLQGITCHTVLPSCLGNSHIHIHLRFDKRDEETSVDPLIDERIRKDRKERKLTALTYVQGQRQQLQISPDEWYELVPSHFEVSRYLCIGCDNLPKWPVRASIFPSRPTDLSETHEQNRNL
jgi:hypothetical protein